MTKIYTYLILYKLNQVSLILSRRARRVLPSVDPVSSVVSCVSELRQSVVIGDRLGGRWLWGDSGSEREIDKQ